MLAGLVLNDVGARAAYDDDYNRSSDVMMAMQECRI